MLDKLSPQNRHLVIAFLGAALGELSHAIPNLNIPAELAPFVGAAVTYGTLYVTKLTKQYGTK